jgi:hypothetical protein
MIRCHPSTVIMMLLAYSLVSALCAYAPPGDTIPVQRPGQKQAEPAPAENPEPEPQPSDGAAPVEAPAEGAPAEAAGEPAAADPAAAEPAAEPAPSGPAIAPLGSEPLEPARPYDAETSGITSWREAGPGGSQDWGGQSDEDYYADYQPEKNGTGMFIAGSIAFGLVLTKQVGSRIFCDGEKSINCGSVGWMDRAGLAASIGLLGGGGWLRGTWAAEKGKKKFDDAQVRKRKIAGWTLTGLGFAAIGVDLGFAAACWQSGVGPYRKVETQSPFIIRCNSTATALFADGAAALTTVGMTMGLWANGYAEKRVELDKTARLTSIGPIVGRDHWGVGLGGQF